MPLIEKNFELLTDAVKARIKYAFLQHLDSELYRLTTLHNVYKNNCVSCGEPLTCRSWIKQAIDKGLL